MHERKKGGQRKDKKNERMRDAVADRKVNADPAHPTTDQPDIQSFKPGAGDDKNRTANKPPNPHPNH